MTTPPDAEDLEQELQRCMLQKDPSLEERYLLDVDYKVDMNSLAFDDPSPAATTEDYSTPLIRLGSADFRIDISPDDDEALDPISESRQLESRAEGLEEENAELRAHIKELEEKVTKLKIELANNTPLPTLYSQLSTARKEIEALEKRCQELEAENAELAARTEKKEPFGWPEMDQQELSRAPSLASPLKRAHTLYAPGCLQTPRHSTQTSTAPVFAREDFEAAKLEFAERLVEKEDTIQKLREQRDASVNRLNMLEAGIDGLETRFQLQLSTYQAEVTQKFERLLKSLDDLQNDEAQIEKQATAVQTDVSRILKSFPAKIQDLAKKYHSKAEKGRQERLEMEERLEDKTKNLEEAKKQILALSDEANQQGNCITERENTIEELHFRIASLKAQRLVPGGVPSSISASQELEAMRRHVAQLEAQIAEQQLMNETLLRERDEAEGTTFSVTAIKDDHSREEILKENQELRTMLMEESAKLLAVEEHNDSLKEEIENQADFFGQCLNLEEEIEAQRRVNRGLEEHLSRRKKRIDSLQNELGKLRQQLGDMEGGFGHRKRTKSNKAAVSAHMDELLQLERQYQELDKILSGVQAERDELLQDKASLNKMMHSLIKENKVATRSLNKLRSEGPALREQLDAARGEITKLQARVKVETLARQHSGKSHASSDVEEDIMSKLVASQIALAEMDERMIKLRKELHKSVARNMYLSAKVSRLDKQLRSQ